MQLIDKKNHIFGALDFIHHRLDALLKLAAIFRPRHHQGEVERDDAFLTENVRHVPARDLLRQPFRNRGLAHAGFAQQYRVVFRPPAKNLNHPLNFILPTDHRIELVFAGQFRKVAAECPQGRSFGILFPGRRLRSLTILDPAFIRRKIRIEFLKDFIPAPLDVHVQRLQNSSRRSLAFPEQAEQNMFRANVIMAQLLGFFLRQRKHLFDARRVRNIADHLGFWPRSNLFFNLQTNGIEVESHFLDDVDSHALPQLDQAEQEMFGADIVMIKPVSLFACQRQHLLGAGCKILHFHNENPLSQTNSVGAVGGVPLGRAMAFSRSRIKSER